MAMATTSTQCLTPSASNSSVSSSNRGCPDADNTTSDTFPAGLRVLVVDDDPICLLILDRMLRHCQYQVTTCGRATDALALLRQNRNDFDVIISDVYMPDMDGFKLLELVGLEMDLPVIMMSANGETSAVMKGIKHGACDYLLKPVRMEELRNIWQHVVRKKWRSAGQATSHEVDKARLAAEESEHNSSANEGMDGMWKQSKKRKESKEEEEDAELDTEDPSSTKKPRVVWSVELHQQFVNAVNQLGIDKAVPKRILELMNVQGLTRENVASHLQKYRLYLKRISGVAHQSGGLNPPFPVTSDSNFGSVNAAGLGAINDLRMLSGPSPQALVSSLQSGILGRLNTANLGMANVDPSILLRLAALQGPGNGAVARAPTPSLPSCGQSMLNVQESFQAGPSDVSQFQVSQLGAFAGSLDKGPLGALSTLQQQQLLAMASTGNLGGPLPRVGNNQQANASNSAFLMQSLQHQPVGGHLTSNEGGLPMPTSRMGAQHGLPEDMEPWVAPPLSMNASGFTGQTNSSLRLLSGSPLTGASMLGPSGRGVDVDSKGLHIANPGNVAARAVSSPLVSGGIDELSTARISSPVLSPGDNVGRGYGSKFGLLSGLKQEQESYTGHRSHGAWQGLNISQDPGSLNERPINNETFAAGHNQIVGSGRGHPCSPGFSTGTSSSFSLDNAHFNALPSMRDMRGEPSKADSSTKIKEEGQIWLTDPTSDELLTMVLKQQQERLGLAESELGGADCYTLNNMYVK